MYARTVYSYCCPAVRVGCIEIESVPPKWLAREAQAIIHSLLGSGPTTEQTAQRPFLCPHMDKEHGRYRSASECDGRGYTMMAVDVTTYAEHSDRLLPLRFPSPSDQRRLSLIPAPFPQRQQSRPSCRTRRGAGQARTKSRLPCITGRGRQRDGQFNATACFDGYEWSSG